MSDQLKLFVSFLKNSNDCISLFNLDGVIVFMNQKAGALVGFSEDTEGSKIQIENFFNYRTREHLIEIAMPALFKNGNWEGELQVEHSFTGQSIDVHVHLFFIDDTTTNEPLYICMTQRDIRGQKATEQLIFEGNQLLDAFMDNLPDHIYVKDKSCHFMRINKAMAKWFGLNDPDEIVGKWDFDIFTKEHAVKAYIDELEIIESGEAKKNIIEVETWPDKADTWVRTSKIPLYNTSNECVGIIGISSDITELVQAEKEIRGIHKQTRRILASITSILIAIGPDEEITQWNEAAEKVFGIKAETVLGKKFLSCGIQWDWLIVLEEITHCLDNNKLIVNDIKYKRPNGTEGFLDLLINRITDVDDNEEHNGYLLIANEITERKHLESQLSHAQKLESIGQLAAGIAHEINTPIQYVGDNVHFLKQGFERVSDVLDKCYDLLKAPINDSVAPDHIGRLKSSIEDNKIDYIMEEIPAAINESLSGVERVANIVKAMKEFSHPGTGEKTLTDLNKALESTITVSRNEWKYVAEMETEFAPDIPPVPCLPGELNQVFLNLIINAAHAIISAAKAGSNEKGKIKISTALIDDFVEIRVSDTGIGIPPAIQKKVFDPFFTTKEVGKGTGQGLAISHNVVKDKHGGSLTFESEVGNGTTFIVLLPVNDSKG